MPGTFGNTPADDGVSGTSGTSDTGRGAVGTSTSQAGVWGQSDNPDRPGIFGIGPRLAGRFQGDVDVTGDLGVAGVAFS